VISAMMAGYLLAGLLQKNKPVEDPWRDRYIQLQDSMVRDKYRQADIAISEAKEKIRQSEVRDSTLQQQLIQNKIKREKIPATINNYSDDELRAAVAEFNATH